MIEGLNNLYKKYEGLLKLLIMVIPLVFASWQYLDKYIDVPERMDAFESRAKTDSSIYMQMWYGRNHYQDSINNLHKMYLDQDFDTLRTISRKLQKNKIR